MWAWYLWYLRVYSDRSDLSLVHLIVGVGSPTELQGRRTSFIQGVVTVPPKDRILAGTAHKDATSKTQHASLAHDVKLK